MRPLPAFLASALQDGGTDLSVVVVRLGAMGDIVRVLPAVRLLRFEIPDARIHWICDDRWAVLLRGHPDLDGILEVPRSRWDRSRGNPWAWARMGREMLALRRGIRSLGCGLAVDFHGNFRSGVLTRWTSAEVRLGHGGHQQKEGNRFLTTHRVDPGPERRRSRIERHLALVRALGVPDDVLPDAGFKISREEAESARAAARDVGAGPQRPYAVINPGASRAQRYKQPPVRLLAAAAQALEQEGTIPLVIHGPGERDAAEEVAAAAGGGTRVAPPTSLRVLMALLFEARLFVGGDSGPLHLACGVGCPVVGLYGPTDPAVNAPWNVPFRVVSPPGRTYTGIKRLDRSGEGFAGLGAEPVEAAVRSLLTEIGATG